MSNNSTERYLTPEQVFTEHMRSARNRVGLTQAALAQTLRQQFGLEKIERQAILDIEKGKRRVSLNEAFAICAALDMAPVYAFTPWEGENQELKIGGGMLDPEGARAWVRGNHHGLEASYPEGMNRFYYANVRPRRRAEVKSQLQATEEWQTIREARMAVPPALRAVARSTGEKEEGSDT
jgi:DNA-binding XRE family transcriptional regulator